MDQFSSVRFISVISVNIKWNKDVLKDIEVDPSLPPAVLKAQLFSLTNVPVERQKLMVKGQTIGDESWGKVTLSNGLTLLMMGSADPVPDVSAEKVKFVEDMTESQLAEHLQMPAGLRNLGKTLFASRSMRKLKFFFREYVLHECDIAMLKKCSGTS